MLKTDRAILGRQINHDVQKLPFPFDIVSNHAFAHSSASPNTPRVIHSLLNAIIVYKGMVDNEALGDNSSDFSKETAHIAMGYRTIENGQEECYVEYQSNNGNPDTIYLTVYNPNTGDVHGSEYKLSTKRTSKVEVVQNISAYDGTALWLAMMPTMLSDPEIGAEINTLLEELFSLEASNHLREPIVMQEVYDTTVRKIMEKVETGFIYENPATDIKLKHDSDTLLLLNKQKIINKTFAPTKKVAGEFKVFHNPAGSANELFEENITESFNPDDYRLPFTKENLSAEEMTLIPQIPVNNVTSKESIEILTEMKETWNNPRATKVTQVFLEGGAGSGKSHMARFIAAVLQRPFVSFTCSPNTDEADIKGALLPVVNSEKTEGMNEQEKKILEALYKHDDEEMFDAVAEIAGYPTIDDCYFDPEYSYEQITGEDGAGCDSQKAYTALCNKVMEITRSLIKKCGKPSGEVQYKYIPSNIVRAIKNGWILELQEPSCMLQQGMLSCLFDVLDKDSIGIINTPCGDIKRHEDFMIIATTNRKYRGTKPLNEAARSRFQYFLKLETPSAEVVAQRIMAKVGLDLRTSMQVAKLFKGLEEKIEELNAGAVTLRGAYAFADAVKRGKDIQWAAERYLLWSATTADDDVAELNIAIEEEVTHIR